MTSGHGSQDTSRAGQGQGKTGQEGDGDGAASMVTNILNGRHENGYFGAEKRRKIYFNQTPEMFISLTTTVICSE